VNGGSVRGGSGRRGGGLGVKESGWLGEREIKVGVVDPLRDERGGKRRGEREVRWETARRSQGLQLRL